MFRELIGTVTAVPHSPQCPAALTHVGGMLGASIVEWLIENPGLALTIMLCVFCCWLCFPPPPHTHTHRGPHR